MAAVEPTSSPGSAPTSSPALEVVPVPSEYSPADRGGPEDRLYDVEAMVEDIGEDPARWLDRNLEHHGVPELEEREFAAWDEPNYRLVPDDDVSKPLEMVKGRIDGIDSIAVARAWQAVERRLRSTPDGGREVIIDYLDDRIDDLEANGERDLPGRCAEELRELGVEAYENVAPKPEAVYLDEGGEEQNTVSADEKLAAMADGGEE